MRLKKCFSISFLLLQNVGSSLQTVARLLNSHSALVTSIVSLRSKAAFLSRDKSFQRWRLGFSPPGGLAYGLEHSI